MPNHLQDGFSSVITLANAPNINLWDRRVKPTGFDGGGPIEEATMYSERWRVRSPKSLITATESTMVAAYHPSAYADYFAASQRITVVTVTFSNGSTLSFYGWLDKFDPQELVEGESPNANITIFPSMQDTAYIERDFTLTP